MKIAVASQNFRTVTPHAGRTRRFLVYEIDPEGSPVEVDRLDLPKEMSLHEFEGEGPHPLDAVDIVIAGSFGPGFAQRMARRGIVAMATEQTDPTAAIETYLANPQVMSTAPCAGGHQHHHHHEHKHEHKHRREGGECRGHDQRHRHRQSA